MAGKKVLIVTITHGEMGDTGHKTGVWLKNSPRPIMRPKPPYEAMQAIRLSAWHRAYQQSYSPSCLASPAPSDP